MKNYFFLLITCLLITCSSFAQGNRIISIDCLGEGIIEVKGYSNGPMWLGLTLNPDNWREKDFEAVKVDGNFKIQFSSVKLDPSIVGQESYYNLIPVVARLWGKKVLKWQCNGVLKKACKYCQKNGYHLEDRKTTIEGNYKIL